MVQNTLTDKLYIKLEVLRQLSLKESMNLSELSKELGMDEEHLKSIVEELSRNYLIRLEREHVIWSAGDNPARLKPWGWNYIYKIIVGSTMAIARKSPPWTLVVAEYQFKSYGRHGKKWISDLGGVWVSYRVTVTPPLAQVLPMVIPAIVCSTLREGLEIPLSIKWPNDVVYTGKKVLGILLEGEVIGDKMFSTIGIGLNANNEPPIETSTSLKLLVNKLIPRNKIIAQLTGIMGRLEDYAKDPRKVQTVYLDLLDTLGRKVRVYTVHGELVRGVARAVTDTGDLVVESDTGFYKFSSSEVYELRYED